MQQDWAQRFGGPDDDASNSVCVDDSGNVYITGGVQVQSSLKCVTIKYNKNGDSLWVRDYIRPGSNYNQGYDIKLDDSDNVYIAGGSVIKYDRNGNLKWTGYNAAEYRKLILDSSGNIYAAGLGGGRYVVAKYDRNGNNSWVDRSTGGYKLMDLKLDCDGNVIILGESLTGGGSDFTTIKYSNNGNRIWTQKYYGLASPPQQLPGAVAVDDQCNVYVTGASQDASQIYNSTTIKYDSSGNIVWIKRIYPPANGQDIAVDKSYNVYISARSNGNNYAIKFDSEGNLIWMRTYPTTNILATNKLVLILDSVNNVYVTANIDSNGNTCYGAIKYDNNGNRQFVVSYYHVNIEYGYVNDMALGKNGSVYLTGISNMTYATVKYSPILTGISEYNLIPDQYSLSQNYPNPFNPVTKINYELRVTNYVTLTVFDALSKEVAALVNEKQNAGKYSVEFDGSNLLPSGIYFYRLTTDGFSDTKRMILLK
ncbi:MAG: SBBP repeat-containing protein [Ignavibacteria bacterium]|nr:SBBP repeat-containing protein [Ignavibacteria bacterium]